MASGHLNKRNLPLRPTKPSNEGVDEPIDLLLNIRLHAFDDWPREQPLNNGAEFGMARGIDLRKDISVRSGRFMETYPQIMRWMCLLDFSAITMLITLLKDHSFTRPSLVPLRRDSYPRILLHIGTCIIRYVRFGSRLCEKSRP